MANRIKGITVEIGGDVTKLDKALKDVNKEINSTQSQLKDVERLLKLDPTNTTLLAQKQQLLTKAIEDTSKKLATLKEAEKQAQKQFERGEISQEQYQGLQREIIATEQNLKKLKDAAEDSETALEKVGNAAKKVGDAAGTVAEKTKGLSAAATAGATGLAGLAVKAGQAADDLNTLAKQSGFGTDEIQKWQYAADRIDVSVDDIVGAAKKLKKNMVSTSSDVTAAWDQLGVAVTDNNGELRDSTEVFYEVLTALSQVENETERDILAMQLFGKSADSLAGIVDDGGAALRELGAEAETAGLILSQDALDGANAFNDGLDTIKAKATASAMSAGASLAENLLPVMDGLVNKMSGVLKWVSNLDGGQLKLLATILLVVAAISPVAKIIQGISGAVSVVTAVIPAITGGIALFTGAATTGSAAATAFAGALTFITGPVGIAVAAIAGIIAVLVLLWNNCESFREAVTAAWEAIKGAFQGFLDWIQATFAPVWAAIVSAAQTGFEVFRDFLCDAWEVISSAFLDFVDWFQSTFGPVWDAIIGAAQAIFEAFQDALGVAWDGITEIFQVFINFLQGVFEAIWGDTLADAQDTMETVGGVIQTVVGVLSDVFSVFVTFLSGAFLTGFRGALQNALEFFSAIKDSIVQIISGILTYFQGIIEFIVGAFTGDWEKAWQGVQNIFKGIFEALIGIAKAPINGIIGLLNTAIDAVNAFIGGINSALGMLSSFGVNIKIPLLSHIAYLAKGGILEAGSAIVGERGPELLSLMNGKARVTPLTDNGGGSGAAAPAAVGGFNQTINISAVAMSPSEVARQTRNATRRMIAGARA